MNSFDFIMAVVIVVFGIIGALRGLIREVLSLVTWILSCVIAWIFAGHLEGRFEGVTESYELRMVAAFLVLFSIVFLVCSIAAFFLNKSIAHRRSVKLPNTMLGAVMGSARAAVVIVIAFLLAGLTAIPQQSWWRDAALAPLFQSAALFVSDYLPRDVARHIRYD